MLLLHEAIGRYWANAGCTPIPRAHGLPPRRRVADGATVVLYRLPCVYTVVCVDRTVLYMSVSAFVSHTHGRIVNLVDALSANVFTTKAKHIKLGR